MFKKLYLVVAVLIIASMALSACQQAATPAPQEPAAPKIKVCQVTDTGGIDDKSFNATAWKGVEDAMKELGVEGKYLESQQQTDYEKNINAFIEDGCDLIVTVGFLLGDATKAAAEANPNQKFAIVDFAYDPTIPNVLGLTFATDQAAFLAGYAAAGATKTGKVGTFGGIQIPPVTVFMDGFALGVKYYNEKHGTNVEVLGWDVANQTGLFTGNFESTDDGRQLGQTLMDEGADIIMPVAGPVGLGTAAAVQERGNAWIIGVDTDWTISASQFTDVIFTSVLKRMDNAVFEAAKEVVEGTFKGGLYVGTLANDGVGIPEFLAGRISDDLKAELEQVKADIIAGKIKTTP
ncbi:nucleoside-binding protein [Bellilinea caldifistulae]|uniref:Membrane protein n=1 Tax=Bellilinea caldifistulae TaxID=360411 RepID=A0A0P6Y2S9_9CHLR|nr:BMP family ABC transporter substrate-binding protein [Bellilinea caldifistulae]KPL75961.1 membrane protein [Bellilinea caldifistulae]GAP11532.1 nucleoside-binding protein [Bellilinea caldifistulae]